MSTVARTFGRRLASLRKLQGITQARLAELLGVTPEYVSNLERGSSTPSFELIGRIADVLQTEIANLFLFAPEHGASVHSASPDWSRYLTGAGSWSYDVAADDLWWSPSMYRLFGLHYQEDMPTLDRYQSLVHPEDLPKVEAEREQLFASGTRAASGFRIIRCNGETRHVVGYTEVERSAEGSVVRATGELVDVTEQKRLERSLRDRQRELEERVREQTSALDRTVSELKGVIQEKEVMLRRLDEREARFRSLVENMNEVFWINDRTTNKLLYMSPSFERVFGTGVEILRNDVRNFINLVHPEDRERAMEAFRRARGGGGEYQDFYRTVTPDGEVRWIHSRGRPFGDDPRLFAGMAEDVTELNDQRESHRRLLAGLSHEVRNPALALNRILEIVAETDDPGRRRELIDYSRFAAEQIVNMSESALRVAAVGEAAARGDSRRFALTEMLRRLGGLFAAQGARRGITVSVGVDPEVPAELEGDASGLRQILFNLLGNAVKFTPEGSVRLIVSDSGRGPEQESRRISFAVEDTGSGIEPERLDEIFAWMKGTQPSVPAEEERGLGIGLSLVRSLVDLLDGEVDVASTPGQGTTFAVTIPFRVPEDSETASAEVSQSALEGCRFSILLVEDEEIPAIAATAALEDAGCTVERIPDAEPLAEILQQRSFDLVILDVNLKGTHAVQSLERLSEELPPAEWPPILVVTAYTSEPEERQLRSLGIDGYANKHYDWSLLSQAIQGALSNYQAKQSSPR